MGINLINFLSSKSKSKSLREFQDLDHLDGVSISTISAKLYDNERDDLVMFYFRDGANFASLYTQSNVVSENIKWNLNQKTKKIYSLVINTRNANCFTGKQGYKSLEKIADVVIQKLNEKQKEDRIIQLRLNLKKFYLDVQALLAKHIQKKKLKTKFLN